MTPPDLEQIARLNDRCRHGLDRAARIVFTSTCLAAVAASDDHSALFVAQAALLASVRGYSFGPDDGPERDFGAFDFAGQRIFFKIDYYDLALEFGSDDPADASVTRRVMTVMLAQDY